MDLKDIIQVVEKQAETIAEEEILKYQKAVPELNLTPEAKDACRVRSISQLTLQLSKFHFKEDLDLQEQFNEWFSKNEEEDLRRTCKHCLDDEAKKIRNEAAGSMSSLDAYLKKHLGDAHQID
ncbi:MAG: hypothetical protein IKP29_07175 [Pseudobutyrivibrio sp.]|jgi:ribosomal protein S17E|nr:hypothetical protein [Pseudobutyrivibrio sp.]